MPSFISAVQWIPRGAASANPKRYELNDDELKRVEALAQVKLDEAKIEWEAAKALKGDLNGDNNEDAWEDEESDAEPGDVDMEDADTAVQQAQQAAVAIKTAADPNDLSVYNLDTYDEESKGSAMGAFSNVRGLQYYQDNTEDPYITLKDKEAQSDDEDEELQVFPTDNLLVAARTQDDVSQLDVYVYDDSSQNLYIHHDLLLPAMPLALEWLSFTPSSSSSKEKSGNFVAVATMDPEIEIWNLDLIDGLYPDAILGSSKDSVSTSLETLTESIAPLSIDGSQKKKKKKKKATPKTGPNEKVHTDSVLSLSWNRSHPSLLASSSADTTVKLWDLSSDNLNTALRSYALHDNKVSAVQWNQRAPTVLLSGAWGGALKVFDTRTSETVLSHVVQHAGDVECIQWNAHREAEFFIGLENGQVQLFDSRMMGSGKQGDKARLWMLDAHAKSVSSLDYGSQIEGLLVTGGTDKLVKLWSVGETAEGKNALSLVASRDLGVGNVFSSSFCPDDPSTIAVAGSHGSLQIWDTACNAGVRQTFGDKLKAAGKDMSALSLKGNGGVVGLNIDENEDTSDEED